LSLIPCGILHNPTSPLAWKGREGVKGETKKKTRKKPILQKNKKEKKKEGKTCPHPYKTHGRSMSSPVNHRIPQEAHKRNKPKPSIRS
jgi:hypothetical protein